MRACKRLVLMLAAMSILCAALPLSAADTVTDNAAAVADNEASGESSAEDHLGWEWFGVRLGGPMLWENQPNNREMWYVHDIILPTYRWQWAYLTTGILHVQLIVGDTGASFAGGCRIPLGYDLDYELRIGASLGFQYRIYESLPSLIAAPQFQVIANFHRFSFGIGVEVPVFYHLEDYIFDHEPGQAIQKQVLLYLRFSVT